MKSTHWRKEKEQILLVQHMNHLTKDTLIKENFITSWFWIILSTFEEKSWEFYISIFWFYDMLLKLFFHFFTENAVKLYEKLL